MLDGLDHLPPIHFVLAAALVAAGIIGHFLKKLHDLEAAGTILLPTTYVKQRPYAFASAVFGAYLLAATFYFMGQLNYVVAIFCGVLCSSAFDSLRARAAGQMLDKETEGG